MSLLWDGSSSPHWRLNGICFLVAAWTQDLHSAAAFDSGSRGTTLRLGLSAPATLEQAVRIPAKTLDQLQASCSRWFSSPPVPSFPTVLVETFSRRAKNAFAGHLCCLSSNWCQFVGPPQGGRVGSFDDRGLEGDLAPSVVDRLLQPLRTPVRQEVVDRRPPYAGLVCPGLSSSSQGCWKLDVPTIHHNLSVSGLSFTTNCEPHGGLVVDTAALTGP